MDDDEDDIIAELMGEFLLDLAEKRDAIAMAIADNDVTQAAALAHMIAGAALTFGITDLGNRAKHYERAARSEGIVGAQAIGTQLMQDIDSALARSEAVSTPPAGR